MGGHKFISWTAHKKKYDKILVGILIIFLLVFTLTQFYLYPNTLPPLAIIKSTGCLAILMLFFILSIGPLSRLDKRFLPILYNRRHLGVSMFIVSLIHGVLSLVFFHGFGNTNPLASLFTSNKDYTSISGFPFMTAGFFALLYLMIMAITSHDFWNNKLTAPVWKTVHMGVYFVFVLIMLHVFSGILQGDSNIIASIFFIGGFIWVITIHLLAAVKRSKEKKLQSTLLDAGYLSVGNLNEIEDSRAKIVCGLGKSIAVFKDQAKLYAMDNFCQHQGGPLGEGKIIDGCVTCPWHGYQYLPQDGKSPPPFEEKVDTYAIKLVSGQAYVSTTPITNDSINSQVFESNSVDISSEFYIGYKDEMPAALRNFTKKIVWSLLFCAVAFGVILPHGLEPMKESSFNFSERVTKKGILIKSPVPILRTQNENTTVDYLLVSAGKFTAFKTMDLLEADKSIDLEGREVELSATEISYDNKSMLELTEGIESFTYIGDKKELNDSSIFSGSEKLHGEIVDPKCFFGAMNPATGKLHKSCAVRCLLGGIPAVLATEDNYYIILGNTGESINGNLISVVGEDVILEGKVTTINNWNYLWLGNPDEIKRLSYRNILNNKKDVLCSN